MKKILSVLLAGAMLLTAGCSSAGAPSSSAPSSSEPASSSESSVPAEPAVELMVSAAASLTDCLEELKTLYTKDHSNITITYNFGASGSLQQQIEQGAPADIFVSAGKKQMTALQEAGLMQDDSVKDILENKVVLITPKDGTALESFEKLTDAAVTQIAVGEPESVPVGQYTQQIFESLKLTETIKSKLVYAKDVREVLSWVETGNVQAGIVYETDARISDKVSISCTAPADSHKKVIYPMGIVKETKHADEAKAFADFLFSDTAKEVFAKYGFSPLF
ncbi:molybdate ABC transporter substrate-binding protein [Hydrogenoanaerobacterium sp.]|uniref:molybdate ABC transporter substrate-binding protein n=1 Tax=Hydrogenoanaerobacterium sp. TaxID=2953763 RepID=UPI0028A19DD5|nr:molybdate ABC transporter substrate-binding protein [Hydrogenoanaerobacterium sp.]